MLLKYGVNPTMSHVVTKHFDAIDAIFIKHTTYKIGNKTIKGREGIITSANDLSHSVSSIHYKLKGAKGATKPEAGAIDLRTRDIIKKIQKLILHDLKHALGKDYDIIIEPSHIHLEFDPK